MNIGWRTKYILALSEDFFIHRWKLSGTMGLAHGLHFHKKRKTETRQPRFRFLPKNHKNPDRSVRVSQRRTPHCVWQYADKAFLLNDGVIFFRRLLTERSHIGRISLRNERPSFMDALSISHNYLRKKMPSPE